MLQQVLHYEISRDKFHSSSPCSIFVGVPRQICYETHRTETQCKDVLGNNTYLHRAIGNALFCYSIASDSYELCVQNV